MRRLDGGSSPPISTIFLTNRKPGKELKVIKNTVIPFPGFLGLNLFGLIFVRKEIWYRIDTRSRILLLRHEAIHTAQMRELGFFGFYLLYFLEWIWRLLFHTRTAYRGISFEREARAHELDPDYLSRRRPFAQWRKTQTIT